MYAIGQRDGARGEVGLIGLGQMGRPLARRLLSQGWQVVAWNRTPGEWQRLAQEGAVLARDPAEVMDRAGLVMTSLPDDAAVRRIALGESGLATHGARGGLLVDLSTTTPEAARSLAADL